ncbi:type II toxin-antitoxin system VapC family toxin [Arvimicrobium flavum]|uniref:type II toxin-antitoxin system VapC family toxin n=1 Tax=Arvimicrobium flavum TaxID=3393320 RepID=UPI00237A4D9B|nr:type II toxin-antitoxin system VapC family toxin [Mesorhizobium shangrilense]
MIVLDTNIVSELQRPRPAGPVLNWIASIDMRETFVCDPVLMEQAYGAERHFLRSGSIRYRTTLSMLRNAFVGRTLEMDTRTFERAGVVRALRESLGRPISVQDAMIAAICLVHGATLATRNVRDFVGLDLKLVNPFEAGA